MSIYCAHQPTNSERQTHTHTRVARLTRTLISERVPEKILLRQDIPGSGFELRAASADRKLGLPLRNRKCHRKYDWFSGKVTRANEAVRPDHPKLIDEDNTNLLRMCRTLADDCADNSTHLADEEEDVRIGEGYPPGLCLKRTIYEYEEGEDYQAAVCHGKFVRGECHLAVADLAAVRERNCVFAGYFDARVDSAAMLCQAKKIRTMSGVT